MAKKDRKQKKDIDKLNGTYYNPHWAHENQEEEEILNELDGYKVALAEAEMELAAAEDERNTNKENKVMKEITKELKDEVKDLEKIIKDLEK